MFPLDETAEQELDKRLDAHRAEVLAEELHHAADEIDQAQQRLVVKKTVVNLLRRRANQAGEKATPAGAPATPSLTIYRASHDSIVMGLYTTAAAAREHCETEERRSWATGTNLSFDWIEDEEDGIAELTAWVGGEECTTGYVVTALEVASVYDEEADE
jgi:hypothetical protein